MTVVMSAGEVRADVATGGRDELGRVEDLKIQADLTDLTCGLIEGDMLPGLSGTVRDFAGADPALRRLGTIQWIETIRRSMTRRAARIRRNTAWRSSSSA